MKIIKIAHSPFEAPVGHVYDLIITLSAPYNDKSITILINANLTDYKENDDKEGMQVRQVTVTDTSNATTVNLVLNQPQTVTVDDKDYKLELISVSKSSEGFPSFEITVSEQ